MSYKDQIHDDQSKKLGRSLPKGPDGVTLKPGRVVRDGVTVYESTGKPVANKRDQRRIIMPDRSILDRIFNRAVE